MYPGNGQISEGLAPNIPCCHKLSVFEVSPQPVRFFGHAALIKLIRLLLHMFGSISQLWETKKGSNSPLNYKLVFILCLGRNSKAYLTRSVADCVT